MRQFFMSKFTSFHLLFLSFILFFTGLNLASAQEKWSLSVNKEGIQVYMRPIENSKIKAIKVVTSIPASSSQLLAAIMDIQTCGEWVYHSKENVMIKQVSPLDLIYYSLVDVPWPAEDRDYVVHIQAEQDPQTKVITVNSPCIPGYIGEKKDVVRISHSVGKWTITPVSKNLVRAEYILEVDPMGNIPAWLINLFATKGPLETFRNLKAHVQKDVYKKAHFKLISD
ncbi:Lipid-binding START domain protein [Pedobacter cryoconitis]|uniref:Lipid-binding START domain protein n=2 Tax=Pedobacter cryoconitis TaxID=188932 RepID=A0A127VDU2_9SPHI|nr:Lipid-binding START domain protein [Pedobacter cryoconitis]